MKKILFALLFLAGVAHASPSAEVKFVYVRGPHVMDFDTTKILLQDVKAKYWQNGIRINYKILKRVYDRNIPLRNQTNYLYLLQDTFYKIREEGFASLFLTPPLIDGSTLYIAGVSFQSSYPNGLGYAVVEFENANGDNRYIPSVVTVEHELGHQLGARHRPLGECSVMDPDAGACAVRLGELSFNAQSIQQIKNHLNQAFIKRAQRRRKL